MPQDPTPRDPTSRDPTPWDWKASGRRPTPWDPPEWGCPHSSRVLAQVLGAQHLLVELADGGAGQLCDEFDDVRQLPLRELREQPLTEVVRGRRLTVAQHDVGDGPLVPLLVRHRDDRGFVDPRVVHDG